MVWRGVKHYLAGFNDHIVIFFLLSQIPENLMYLQNIKFEIESCSLSVIQLMNNLTACVVQKGDVFFFFI